MSERLLKLGADPQALYRQFQAREEERIERQDDVQRRAEGALLDAASGDDFSVREYRKTRLAGDRLLAEPHLELSDMSYRDYRKARVAEERGDVPLGYREYAAILRNREPEPDTGDRAQPKPEEPFSIDDYRFEREDD